jgi:iron complex outermembrane receptor protein
MQSSATRACIAVPGISRPGAWSFRASCVALAVTSLVAASVTGAFAQAPSPGELKRLSLEELLHVEITTMMRVPEPTTAIPAAVFVITQDDIRRSGATSLPEVLRLAPGLQVAQQDAGRYAIGIRGFADRLARSMLVLMDGRAVYSPLFAGTYWEVQDTMLEDIERIEIIRGPGGTLWGANAVNGIINIITKRSQDTRGTLVSGTLGSATRGPIAVRYGGTAGAHGSFRAYAKAFDREPQSQPDGADFDQFSMVQGGLRGDWTLSRSRTLTLQGDVYTADLGQRFSVPLTAPPFTQSSVRDAALSGGNVLARWTAATRAGEYQLQTYYDRTRRDERPVAETRDTFDLDFQHRRRFGQRHGIVWGTGYRVTSGRITALAPTAFEPPDRTDNLYTAFVQDDFTVRPDRLRFVFGTKLEHNDYSGFELQPSGRMMWTINASNSLFAAITRAVRTPSRVETDYTTTSLANPAIPAFVRLQPNREFAPEELTAYELGYRVRTVPSLYVTVSGFVNSLENTLSTELLTGLSRPRRRRPGSFFP